MINQTETVTGRCCCAKVRYRATGVCPLVTECHCSQCRRQSGHRYATISADTQNLEIEGANAVTWFSASPDARRGFCATCGSHLFWEMVERGHTSILAASVDEPNALAMSKHIFVEAKGCYYEIGDDLPRFEGYDTPGEA